MNLSNYKILIVDDNATNVLLASKIVQKAGYKIDSASNGHEALQKVENDKPDLILLDIMMPGMDGYEVAQKIKENPETSDIVILFLTALDKMENEIKGFSLGAGDYITKPFRPDVLLVHLKYHVSQIHSMRIIEQQKKELEAAIKGRDQIHSIISQDLKVPLNTLKALHEKIQLGIKYDSVSAEIYDLIKEANTLTQETLAQIENLLTSTNSKSTDQD